MGPAHFNLDNKFISIFFSVISDPEDFEKFFQAKKGMDKIYEEKNASRIKLENVRKTMK